jgi:hypothetical protein
LVAERDGNLGSLGGSSEATAPGAPEITLQARAVGGGPNGPGANSMNFWGSQAVPSYETWSQVNEFLIFIFEDLVFQKKWEHLGTADMAYGGDGPPLR